MSFSVSKKKKKNQKGKDNNIPVAVIVNTALCPSQNSYLQLRILKILSTYFTFTFPGMTTVITYQPSLRGHLEQD